MAYDNKTFNNVEYLNALNLIRNKTFKKVITLSE